MSKHFSWQSAVLESDCESTTKFVLLVVGTYMNQHGSGAFPSYNTIAQAASLGRSTVIKHIDIASEKGWILKTVRPKGNQDNETNLYGISFPLPSPAGGLGVVHQEYHLVHTVDHPSPFGGPPLVHVVDPNTPVLTPQRTPQHTGGGNDDGFDHFWQKYPNKVAKANALKVWKKMKPDGSLLAKILASLEVAKNSDGWKKDDGRFIPHPTTWLNGRRWEDEIAKGESSEEVLDPRAKAPPSWFKLPPGAKWTPGKGVTW